ncbi:glycosyltransferase involved in cell wall biosynthesis [Anoxybacillus vitaminiphilus]|uniref:Glycosyltransferase involved in cell wall biosynthesis n=1 Tax=Paranoxybacillus vitaminiphilus TaxID=581036 RepID=A0A327Y5S0_9BACL|nr:glycosyltransferase family 4 protein [Anoxybacillus vitaminiphilus]RAK15356.1 glycosyltransferase involved in cell wall biosynthesis [Anoxybacillus vitaminiphilus]
MKIAFICTEKLPSPAVKGGAIQLMIDGIAPFISQNHSLTIFSITDCSLPLTEKSGNIEYIRFPKESYEENVAAELTKRTFDVIHVFNRPAGLVKYYKEASPASAFVLSVHNDMFSPLKITKELAEQAIEQSTFITTVSEYIKRTITGRYELPSDKVEVVYSGIDLEQYVPAWTEKGKKIRKSMRKEWNVANKKVILFIGRLAKTKGPHILIQCMSEVLACHHDAVLVIVGGKWFSDNGWNDYVEQLHQLAKPYGEKIIFTNYIPAEKIPPIFLISDVFVCSSQWHEPLARVHYEAMAAGVPIITTNRGGNAEVIHHMENGLVIDDYQNIHSFSKAIHFMLTHREKALQMAKNGRNYVEEHFSFTHVAARLEAIYRRAYNIVQKIKTGVSHKE